MIHDVHLDRNSVTVLLEDELEEGEDDQDIEPFAVEVDLSLNAQRNASNYYTVKKKVHQKLEKTIAATDKATVSAEKKGQRVSAKQGAVKKEVVEQRKTFWYEKFFWFLTTFGDLAVYARDQTQTDTLLRKYMVPTDIFIHCDAARAPVCVLKAASLDKRIAVESILEAGSMCVSRSAAWDSKTSMSAWWVSASTVSPTQVGSYSVSGERNYLKPMPLATAVVAVFRTKSERPWVPLDPEIPVVCSASLVVESSKEPHTPQAALVQAANSSLELLAAQEAIEPPQGDELDGRQEELEAPAAAIRRTGISIRSLTQRNAPKDDDGRSSTSTALDENGAISRRTQHKLKKMKKYAEQDDDEREERMRLLGNRPSRIHKLHSESPTQEPESRPQIVAASEPKASSSKATERPPRIAVDPEKYSTQIAEGDSELKYFNPKPDAEDEAMYAVCLCVPLGVAIQYKHRANITYGQEKKGNAASAIVRHFSSGTEAHASFSTALRFVEAEQLTNQLPSNIKVHFAQQPATGGRGKSQHADPTTSSKASR
ncbi:Hypothetical protein, putative [Bodo saltans]|uniref:NFACT RNA-binding domain-containing protein n=1 Tax=Bodo saltans TaxID=75058 RepID=A0A0S4KDT1_BODSA|nr:Hypothetical protein, putative [Bodo saltans]|eukprot:CUI11043.1 Hypothetical protein, putative [Bodo saltans]